MLAKDDEAWGVEDATERRANVASQGWQIRSGEVPVDLPKGRPGAPGQGSTNMRLGPARRVCPIPRTPARPARGTTCHCVRLSAFGGVGQSTRRRVGPRVHKTNHPIPSCGSQCTQSAPSIHPPQHSRSRGSCRQPGLMTSKTKRVDDRRCRLSNLPPSTQTVRVSSALSCHANAKYAKRRGRSRYTCTGTKPLSYGPVPRPPLDR